MAATHNLNKVDGHLIGDPLDIEMFKSTGWSLYEEDSNIDHGLAELLTLKSPTQDLTISVYKIFEFSSEKQRMGVICSLSTENDLYYFCKGSPEMIHSLCDQSTLPAEYFEKLNSFTNEGLRVIALAYKPIPEATTGFVKHYHQKELEQDLTFVGFIVMKNMIKEMTRPTIDKLHDVDISTIMATGDNLLTAISVGRQCGMIHQDEQVLNIEYNHISTTQHEVIVSFSKLVETKDHNGLVEDENSHAPSQVSCGLRKFVLPDHAGKLNQYLKNCGSTEVAMTGSAFSYLNRFKDHEELSQTLDDVFLRAKIFARMLPDHKAELVEYHQKFATIVLDSGHVPFSSKKVFERKYETSVAMCGDGTNDCKALKAADVGLSLSETDASVAAPFTTKIPDISPIIELIKEGRASLSGTFNIFKYVVVESMVQFISIIILYTIASGLSPWQYFYCDVFLSGPLFLTMTRIKPSQKLSKSLPEGELMSVPVIFSVLTQLATHIIFQLICMQILYIQPWYSPLVPYDNANLKCFENTTIFLFSCLQYTSSAMALNTNDPFRESIFKNKLYCIFLASTYIITGVLIFVSY